MDVNDNAVSLLVSFIVRGIARIRAERNTATVTASLLLQCRITPKLGAPARSSSKEVIAVIKLLLRLRSHTRIRIGQQATQTATVVAGISGAADWQHGGSKLKWETWRHCLLGAFQGRDQANEQGERSDPRAATSDLPLQAGN